jgi:hypothetical protein
MVHPPVGKFEIEVICREEASDSDGEQDVEAREMTRKISGFCKTACSRLLILAATVSSSYDDLENKQKIARVISATCPS